MKLVINTSGSAYFNLACEEYLAATYDEDIFMMWTSVPSILIGKHQNTYSEINVPYVEENNIPVVRRMSGGGTVFCDKGNMNFTFIEGNSSGFTDFRKFTRPILGYLRSIKVPAEFSGRNDLVIDGKKFSGNAQYKIKGIVVHHGTLLIDSVLTDLSKALTPKKEKFSDKSVKSVASRVTNIFANKPDGEPSTVEAFREGLYDYVESSGDDARYYELSEADIQGIEALVEAKYDTWEWNFGKSPKYAYVTRQKFAGGLVEISLDVKKGYIEGIVINGDFFGHEDIRVLEQLLIGSKHEVKALLDRLSTVELGKYMANVQVEELTSLICEGL